MATASPRLTRGGATIYAGDLRDLPSLVGSQQGTPLTPNNMLPADHSWLIYTEYDLRATQVSGSVELIDALREHGHLDTVRCGQPT